MKKAPQALDPVCGMMVDMDPRAIRAAHAGTDYYFCATSCREQFLANPARYLGDVAAPEPEPTHTTWKGMIAPKFGSAGSGGAEYERGPARTKR